MTTKAGSARAKRDAVKQVSRYLGNTPGPEIQRPIEEAVLDLIDRRESPALERVG